MVTRYKDLIKQGLFHCRFLLITLLHELPIVVPAEEILVFVFLSCQGSPLQCRAWVRLHRILCDGFEAWPWISSCSYARLKNFWVSVQILYHFDFYRVFTRFSTFWNFRLLRMYRDSKISKPCCTVSVFPRSKRNGSMDGRNFAGTY